MRQMPILIVMMLVAGTAMGGALNPGSARSDLPPRQIGSHPVHDGREGGEDISTAIVIPGDVSLLPYRDTGATCDNLNDYDEACPYTGSTSADVVYSFTPTEDVLVDIDLCASAYDTKVYVYDAIRGVTACNDDACDVRSFVGRVALTGGMTYYIVVDGYGGDCGAYDLAVGHCELECPAGGSPEGEPPCADNYVDEYNGGCNSSPQIWQPIEAEADGCATICGRGCTYAYQGAAYRDTDWYEATADGGVVSVSCRAEFPLQIILFQSTDCQSLPSLYADVPPCVRAELSYSFPSGERIWLWVGPSVFGGVPESDYVLTVCGLQPVATAVGETSWGRIKRGFR